jgi:hypothetical protein
LRPRLLGGWVLPFFLGLHLGIGTLPESTAAACLRHQPVTSTV